MAKVSVVLPDDLHKRLRLKALEQGTDLQKMFLRQAYYLDTSVLANAVAEEKKALNFPEREAWHTVLDQVLNGIEHQARANALDAEDSRAIAIKKNLGDAERSAPVPERANATKAGDDIKPPGRRTG